MRNKKGQFIKGYTKSLSEETKKRISETCKKRGIGKWMSGRTLSDETKVKISKNNARYWLGKERGQQGSEWVKKKADALRGRKNEFLRKRLLENNPNKGKFGKQHPCWKENKKHPLYKAIRETFKYREWRENIFKRDSYTCQICHIRGGYLEVDHFPKMFVQIIKSHNIQTVEDSLFCKGLWNEDNGRTLCLKCHRKTDTWGRNGKSI